MSQAHKNRKKSKWCYHCAKFESFHLVVPLPLPSPQTHKFIFILSCFSKVMKCGNCVPWLHASKKKPHVHNGIQRIVKEKRKRERNNTHTYMPQNPKHLSFYLCQAACKMIPLSFFNTSQKERINKREKKEEKKRITLRSFIRFSSWTIRSFLLSCSADIRLSNSSLRCRSRRSSANKVGL